MVVNVLIISSDTDAAEQTALDPKKQTSPPLSALAPVIIACTPSLQMIPKLFVNRDRDTAWSGSWETWWSGAGLLHGSPRATLGSGTITAHRCHNVGAWSHRASPENPIALQELHFQVIQGKGKKH